MRENGNNLKTDSELYEDYLSGDNSSYDILILRHIDNLKHYVYGLLHNPQDSEDVTIEAFARIMAKKPMISNGKFKTYLYKTARNIAIRFHDNRLKKHCFSLEEEFEEPATDLIIENTVIKAEDKKLLHQALDRLEKKYKEVLWLVYFEDLSYADAAKVLGVNTKRVDHLLEKGKKALKSLLVKEGFTYEIK